MSLARLKAHRDRASQKPATLNLVSLMDIFTILVFFLMVNSSEVEVIEANNAIKLPDSSAQDKPEKRLAILINADDLLVQGRKVASVSDVLASDAPTIDGLSSELDHQAMRRQATMTDPSKFEGAITIIGDRDLPYKLLKRVMLTCQASSFTHIALAVNRVEKGGDGA